VFSFSLVPQVLVPVSSAAKEAYEDAKENHRPVALGKYILFNGVGEPAQVEETVIKFMGKAPAMHQRFADHHAFEEAEIAEMGNWGLPLVCTPKDAVKVPDVLGIEVWTFTLSTKFGDSMFTTKSFSDWWQDKWDVMKKRAASSSKKDTSTNQLSKTPVSTPSSSK